MNIEHRQTSEPSRADAALAACDFDLEEIEELALALDGDGDAARKARAHAHVAICAACRQVYDVVRAERALFERRAGALRPPRALEPRVLAAVTAVAEARSARRDTIASAARIALGLAACVAVLVGNSWLDRASPSIAGSSRSTDSMTIASSFDEPLACALPVSGFVHHSERGAACRIGPTVAHGEAFASVSAAAADLALTSASDRAICEAEVTSSIATP